MSKFVKNRMFITVFLAAYFLFFSLTAFVPYAGIGVGHIQYGFPFTYYYSHCYGGYYLWSGLIGNCLAGAGFSLIAGLFSTYLWLSWLMPLWEEVSSPEFRAKWYL